MGGNVFAAQGLRTPRMPPAIYNKIIARVIGRLGCIYRLVEAPIEAPEKVDYGDIDVLAVSAGLRPPSHVVAIMLGTSHYKEITGSRTVHYAIPWPNEESMAQDGPEATGDISRSEPAFIQVDINHSRDANDLKYTKFLHAHGDFWTIVGSMIRPFGLTCSDDGLYLRIAGLESWDRKRARVKMTSSTDEILQYLGLDTNKFWQPFSSREACMDFASTCRFHDPTKARLSEESRPHAEVKAEEKKSAQRPMFAYWLDVYLPAHKNGPAGESLGMNREQVVEEAKQTFGTEFALEYEQRKARGLLEKEETDLWAEIRNSVPAEGPTLTYAMKGLKKWVSNGPSFRSTDAALQNAQQAYELGQFDVVKDWALQNWESAANWHEDIVRQHSHHQMRAKLRKLDHKG